MAGKKAHPVVARDRWSKRMAKAGAVRRPEQRSTPPVVVWRASCRCVILSVHLTPEGWALDGRDFKEPLDAWIARMNPDGSAEVEGVPFTLANYRAGRLGAVHPRQVRGVSRLLPLEVSAWDQSIRFEAGCSHGRGHFPLTDVADDCMRAKSTGKPATRRTPPWVELR